MRLTLIPALMVLAAVSLTACQKKQDQLVKVDGSSTVYPITEAVAEEFSKANSKIRVTVGVSGTGGGMKKFTAGEIDIANASRPIKKEEAEAAKTHGVEYLELEVAYDGLTVVVNPANTFVDFLTVAELKKIWEPESKVKTWKDVRPSWPAETLTLYGPGTDSGTFDYFTEVVNGKSKASRADFTKSEDDNVLVTGVAGDKHALGYFGLAYYEENMSKLKAVPIKADDKAPAIAPSVETVRAKTYKPLSRPLYIYVAKKAAARLEVKAFISFYLEHAAALSKQVGYIPTPDAEHQKAVAAWDAWSK